MVVFDVAGVVRLRVEALPAGLVPPLGSATAELTANATARREESFIVLWLIENWLRKV